MDPRALALEVRDFQRTYATGSSVGPISLRLESGTCYGLVGSNGAGKSTLMRCILGLDRATAGSVEVFGRTVRPGKPVRDASGLIEEPVFFDWLDAQSNLKAAFPHRRLGQGELDAVLHEVGLRDAGSKRVRQFSQGMRQRLGLARVLLAKPRLLVLDEPTNGLDPLGIIWLRRLVSRLQSSGCSILLSSHMLHEVQLMCSQFMLLDRGKVAFQGNLQATDGFTNLEDFYLGAVTRDDQLNSDL